MGLYGLADSLYRNRLARQADVDRTALVFEDRRISYGELEARVRRLATGLANAGFKPEDRCAILLYNRPEYVELYYAIAHLGGVAVPLNYYLKGPRDRLRAGGLRHHLARARAGLRRRRRVDRRRAVA